MRAAAVILSVAVIALASQPVKGLIEALGERNRLAGTWLVTLQDGDAPSPGDSVILVVEPDGGAVAYEVDNGAVRADRWDEPDTPIYITQRRGSIDDPDGNGRLQFTVERGRMTIEVFRQRGGREERAEVVELERVDDGERLVEELRERAGRRRG